VATFKFFDRADEFRIEIIGRLAADGVQEVRRAWEKALQQTGPRRLSIDITRLAGYDSAGRRLLAAMYRHGTDFAARTPNSLVFLNEIANTSRTPAPVITAPVQRESKPSDRPQLRAMAAGQ
jgi:ABC-type transporter Mla MlaB component